MVTATKTWRRWCGPPSVLIRAAKLAVDELQAWTSLDSVITVNIENREGVAETGSGLGLIESLHPTDLAYVTSVIVTVDPDRDQHLENAREASRRGEEYPSRPTAAVRIRVTRYDTSLSVEAEDRTRVEGLTQRLAAILGQAATKSPGIDRLAFLAGVALFAGVGASLGLFVSRWLDLASADDHWETAEIVSELLGGALGVALSVVLWWLYPPIEMLGEGGAGRARRFRSAVLGVSATVLLGLVASFVYD